LKVLTYNSFSINDALVRREAQRCLANALLLKPDGPGTFAEVGGVDKFVDAFKESARKRDADDDFLLGRIGFLLTAGKGPVVERLVDEDDILKDLNEVCFILILSPRVLTVGSVVVCQDL
jgi:Guanine nucleotide exchange factor synembryn